MDNTVITKEDVIAETHQEFEPEWVSFDEFLRNNNKIVRTPLDKYLQENPEFGFDPIVVGVIQGIFDYIK